MDGCFSLCNVIEVCNKRNANNRVNDCQWASHFYKIAKRITTWAIDHEVGLIPDGRQETSRCGKRYCSKEWRWRQAKLCAHSHRNGKNNGDRSSIRYQLSEQNGDHEQ